MKPEAVLRTFAWAVVYMITFLSWSYSIEYGTAWVSITLIVGGAYLSMFLHSFILSFLEKSNAGGENRDFEDGEK